VAEPFTSRERSERLPDVPTMLELGLDPREWAAWYAFIRSASSNSHLWAVS
jgi:tripartite-type tricarboxylate transporter receptor subunit TctC